MAEPNSSGTRVVRAPGQDPTKPGAVQSVTLNPGEEVEWHWSAMPDGTCQVTGYTIVPAGTLEKDLLARHELKVKKRRKE